MTVLTDTRLSQVEQGQIGPTSPVSPHIVRSIIDATRSPLFSMLIPPREGNTQDNGKKQHSPPLGVPLTGNALFTISWILGLGVPKAVYSYRKQSVVPTTIDWIVGIMFTLT